MAIFFSHDGSHYQYDQGPYDWRRIRGSSADPANAIAIYKCSQSLTFVDPYFSRFRDDAHAAGFEKILFYHWLSSTTDPVGQAHHCMDAITKDNPLVEGEGFMLDDEEGGVTIAKTLAWKNEMLKIGGRDALGVYTGAYVAGIWQSQLVYDADTLGILAAYTSEAKMLGLPGVHDHLPDVWQYSSSGKLPDGSQLPGVTGRADMNMHYQENTVNRKLLKICGLTAPQPRPNPTPKGSDMAFIIHTTEIEGVPHAWATIDGGIAIGVDDDPTGEGFPIRNVSKAKWDEYVEVSDNLKAAAKVLAGGFPQPGEGGAGTPRSISGTFVGTST